MEKNRQGLIVLADEKSAMDAARNALAGLDIIPHEISRNTYDLDAAFEEIDNIKIEIHFLKCQLLKFLEGAKHGR